MKVTALFKVNLQQNKHSFGIRVLVIFCCLMTLGPTTNATSTRARALASPAMRARNDTRKLFPELRSTIDGFEIKWSYQMFEKEERLLFDLKQNNFTCEQLNLCNLLGSLVMAKQRDFRWQDIQLELSDNHPGLDLDKCIKEMNEDLWMDEDCLESNYEMGYGRIRYDNATLYYFSNFTRQDAFYISTEAFDDQI
eukprot:985011_1